MNDSYIFIIVALLPIVAFMVTVQANPYNALVIRGILGAIAALVYAVLGAADVSLTEALVGTMLAITLYAVAVRSSLVMRLGVLKDSWLEPEAKGANPPPDKDASQATVTQLLAALRTIAKQYHLRLELIPYPDPQSLHQALLEKEIHVTCIPRSPHSERETGKSPSELPPYQTITRIRRLYTIFQSELSSSVTSLTYWTEPTITTPDSGEPH
jgi:putative multicomponent Na+:H+ antiporter subunit B